MSVNLCYTRVSYFLPPPTSSGPQIASELALPVGQKRQANGHSSGQPELVYQAGMLSEET